MFYPSTSIVFDLQGLHCLQAPDILWTRWAASRSSDTTECSGSQTDPSVLVVHHPPCIPTGPARAEFTRSIRDALARGRCVCVKGVYDPLAWGWDKETFKVMTGSPTLDHQVEWIGGISLL